MIDEVADFIRDQIDTSIRTTFDQFNKHTYAYTTTVCGSTLARNLQSAWNSFKAGLSGDMFATADENRATIDAELISITGTTSVEEALRQAAEYAVKEVMLDERKVFDYWTQAFASSSIMIDRRSVKKKGGDALHVKLEVGTVLQTGQKVLDGGKIVPYNLVNTATKMLYKQARSVAFNYLRQKGSKPTGKGVKTMPGKAGVTLRNSGPQDVNPVKAHGKAQAWAGSATISSAGQKQTTIGVLAMAKAFDKMEKVAVKGNYEKEILSQVSEVQTVIWNRLDKSYKLEQYRNVDTKKFDEGVEVDLHATDHKGNSEFARGKYDMPGINRRINAYAATVAETLRKQLGYKKHSDKWLNMKGSTSRRDLIAWATKKQLVEHLLKIKGTRPDFRLKVNKKLLKAVGDARFSGRKSKEKRSRGASKTKVTAAVTGRVRKSIRNKKGKGASGAPSRTTQSPIALRNLLNELLPQQVAQNMGSPALNYITGRFANSARVKMVHQGARGGIGIDYTYMMNPYQTFEPGFAQGSTLRDPRKIIGESIRELATGILGRQPHTIRRT